LSACDNRPVVYQQQPQVVQAAPVYQQPGYVQQAPDVVQDNSANSLATGMLLGHMLSNGGSGSQVNRTVVNKTVIVNNHPAPAAPIAVAAAPMPVVKPSAPMYIPPKAQAVPVQAAQAPRPNFAPAKSAPVSYGGFKRK
jgi:hypothetical protein